VCPLEPFREKSKGRLGLSQFPKTTLGGVPFPVELHLPGVRVVGLEANSESVQTPSLLLKNTPTSYCSHIPTGLSMRLALMVVCTSGVGAFNPFRFALKSPGIDNASQ